MDKTFTMIKPEAVEKKLTGEIIQRICQKGFDIMAIKKTKLSIAQARKFYSVHNERPFFNELVDYITSGPVIAIILLKNNAVQDFRNLIGSTDPNEAEEGTIRKEFAESKSKNAIHGSDSDENANIECDFFFSKTERF
jgi:nucleoside-diphosphate kinase